MADDACKAAYEATYRNAVAQEAKDEKRGWTELVYDAGLLREAFEDGWNAHAESAKAEAQPAGTGVSVEERLHQLEIRRSEMRALLTRLTKYVREGRAEAPGKTRLARLTEQVADYLRRTHEASDILRNGATAPVGTNAWVSVAESLPPPGVYVETFSEHREPTPFGIGRYDNPAALLGGAVSHWRVPIPPPPEPRE